MEWTKWLLCLYLVTGWDYDKLVIDDIDSTYPQYPDDCVLVFEYESSPSEVTTWGPEPETHVQEVINHFHLPKSITDRRIYAY